MATKQAPLEAVQIHYYALIGMVQLKAPLVEMIKFMTGESDKDVEGNDLKMKKFNIIDYALKGVRSELKRARADKDKESEEKVKSDLKQLLNIKKVGKSDITFKQKVSEGEDG